VQRVDKMHTFTFVMSKRVKTVSQVGTPPM